MPEDRPRINRQHTKKTESDRKDSTAPKKPLRHERVPGKTVKAGYKTVRVPDRNRNASARSVALNALCDVTIGDAYANIALDKRLRAAALSDEDRRLATNIFYTALDKRSYIDYQLNHLIDHMPDERFVRELLHVACAQILYMDRVPDYAAVDEAVRQVRAFNRAQYAPMINGTLRNLIRSRDAGTLPSPDRQANPARYMSIMYSLSEAIAARLIRAYGEEEAEHILAYRPDTRWEVIRPNLNELDDGDLIALINKKGWKCEKGCIEHSFRVYGAGDLALDPDYKKGLFSVQSESSILCALSVGARPGMKIIDACAAPGGKTALMAEQMRSSGRVIAYELHDHRVELIRRNAQRLRLYNIRPVQADATVLREDNIRTADAVLIDAPCSGLGVILSKPDLKMRLAEENVESILETQATLLSTCSQYVKAGGILVYSTCTILPEENAEQVTAFLEKNPEFELIDDKSWLPDALKDRSENGMLQLFAHRDMGMEGFFIARMRRKRSV